MFVIKFFILDFVLCVEIQNDVAEKADTGVGAQSFKEKSDMKVIQTLLATKQ